MARSNRGDNAPRSQCGFRRNRGLTDTTFAVRQLMEKASRNLYTGFMDFTKAFDSVNRNAMCVIIKKGMTPKFVATLKCLYRDIESEHLVNNELTSEISVYNAAITSALLFIAETLCGTATCATTTCKSHPPCSVYLPNHQ